ncbi:MAG: Asp-tRNA(Asn)/Glu-tRNA(Gln) amidotransferase GatCAB subunit B, partial [Gemmatimonadota bacterium]
PDLPPLVLTPEWISEQRDALPELPAARRARWIDSHKLSAAEAEGLSGTVELAAYFEAVVATAGDGKAAANWIMGEVLAALNESGVALAQFPIAPARLAALIALVKGGQLSSTAAKTVFATMRTDTAAPDQIAQRDGLLQVGDDSALEQWIDEVWAEHPTEAARFAAGEQKLQGVLVGFLMKKSKGRADPKKLNQLLAARIAK